MNNIRKFGSLVLGASLFALALTGCSDDTWDDHYDPSLPSGNKTLLQLVKENPELSDFYRVLQATHIFRNSNKTSVTYADLLDQDQTLTLWAPKNGQFDVEALLEQCQTAKGDSVVGRHFVMNHLSRTLYSMGPSSYDEVLLLNDKKEQLTPTSLKGVELSSTSNVRAKNGLLHVLDGEVDYSYTVYEALTSIPEYAHIGDFLMKYNRMRLNEDASVKSDVVEGHQTYSDSVLYLDNTLFYSLGRIDVEDSLFTALVPTREAWTRHYEEALGYFNFSGVEKSDSIQRYWVNMSMMQDLFYNNRLQHLSDSAFSTSYSKGDPLYHVFYKPLDEDGIMSSTYVVDERECSNGVCLNLNDWPFTPEQTYFKPIKVEAEYESNRTTIKNAPGEFRATNADSISGSGYLRLNNTSSDWECTFKIPNTLAGTYDVCAVCLPKTVYQATSRDKKPNKFKAVVTYVDENGVERTKDFSTPVTNDGVSVDTVKIGTITLPTCNYAQPTSTVFVNLQCKVSKTEQTKYSRDMYLDCIYFRPNNKNEE